VIPKNLIINADDFGIDPRVSKGIALCVEEGLINSFSVLPFSDSFHDNLLKSLISQHPQIRIGAHLSLMGPATQHQNPNQPAPLYEHPHHYRDFLKLYLTGQYPAKRIYQEWKAQILFIAKYLGGADRLAHLDSHQHLHVLPGIWPVAVALQKEFKIPRLRVPYESLSTSLTFKFPFGFALQALACFRFKMSGMPRQNGDMRRLLGFFTSTQFTLEANRKGLKNVIDFPEKCFELMVHPALALDSNAPFLQSLGAWVLPDSQVREIAELRLTRSFFASSSR
jgi:predicted glycoside hydrolase/deacetylase ChbG (UPF0249 family)